MRTYEVLGGSAFRSNAECYRHYLRVQFHDQMLIDIERWRLDSPDGAPLHHPITALFLRLCDDKICDHPTSAVCYWTMRCLLVMCHLHVGDFEVSSDHQFFFPQADIFRSIDIHGWDWGKGLYILCVSVRMGNFPSFYTCLIYSLCEWFFSLKKNTRLCPRSIKFDLATQLKAQFKIK